MSTDKRVTEELILYIRYIDLESACVQTKLLGLLPVTGHPNADMIFQAISGAFEQYKLPSDLLVGQTSDGATVTLSTQKGVAAKAKAAYNSKLFVQHCLNHRMVLASKAGQQHIPREVEDIICDVLSFFRASAVHTSLLCELLELNEEKYTKLVSYHKIRWLSLQCVDWFIQLHKHLMQYFENTAEDSSVRASVRERCRRLSVKITEPTFLLYLFFLHPQLKLLADVNIACQRRDALIYYSYSRIHTLILSLVEPIGKDNVLPEDTIFCSET